MLKCYKNELFVYFAMVSLVFTVMVFIPFIGFILYNAKALPTVEVNTQIININNNYKWSYNGTHGAGDYRRLQNVKVLKEIAVVVAKCSDACFAVKVYRILPRLAPLVFIGILGLKSLVEIEKLNAMESSKVFGITKFSDMSKGEFAEQMLLPNLDECQPRPSFFLGATRRDTLLMLYKTIFYLSYANIPTHFDWRDRGVVGPVLNQRRCNACWAFSVVGVMESMLAIKKNERLSERLSIQELLDCSLYTKKCQGGNIDSAMWYLLMDQLPIVPESRYPLDLQNEDCRAKHDDSGTKLQSYTILCNVNEKNIPILVANHGPVMVVLNANIWQFYTGGIIHRSCGEGDDTMMRHVVQVVGYNMSADIPYYIVKNSWGTDFGEGGYVRLAMNENICGITRKIAYLDVN